MFLHLAHPHEAVSTLQALCAQREERHVWVFPDGEPPQEVPDVIVVHLMEAPFTEWIHRWPGVPVVWAAWGMDYYGRFKELSRDLILGQTRKMGLLIFKPTAIAPRFHRWLDRLRQPLGAADERWLERVTHVSSFLEEEFPARARLRQDVQYIAHLYGHLDARHWALPPIRPDARGIVIGPGAAFASNLPDAMEWVAERGPSVPVRVSLAYGSKRIMRYVDRKGTRMFPDKWKPLRAKTDLDDFLEWMSRSHCLLVFSLRMQGVRTVLYALMMGLRVVLHPQNPVLSLLQRRGFIVQSSEEIGERDLARPLTPAEQEHNRRLARQTTDAQRVHASLDHLIADAR